MGSVLDGTWRYGSDLLAASMERLAMIRINGHVGLVKGSEGESHELIVAEAERTS